MTQETPPSPAPSGPKVAALLEPRRLLRWIYMGRLSVSSAVCIAAFVFWKAANGDTLAASAFTIAVSALILSLVVTGASAIVTNTTKAPLEPTFLYIQSVFDLCLVTAVVHVTSMMNSSASGTQFSALYILVIAAASLLLPAGGVLLVAALGNVLYFADMVRVQAQAGSGLWLQLAVFACVALGTAYLSNQLRRGGEGSAQLAAELEQVRLRAEEILRNIRSGVITIDAAGRLVYANPMADQLLGLALTGEIGHSVIAALTARAPELARALDRCVHDRVRTLRGESSIVGDDGVEASIGVTTTFMSDEVSGLTTATAIFQDISDQKQSELFRLRAERLEGIAELSASLAHEIKNPLASIRSAVEQLAKMPRQTEDERSLAALVMRESDRLSRLLSEFLDFARVQVARTEPVDVGEVARGVARLVGAHPEARSNARVRCVIAEDGPVIVRGDEDLLHRAIFNLALNAVQASPAGGDVVIEVVSDESQLSPAVEVRRSYPDSEPSVAIRVSDSGPGIPSEIRDRLFDPFITTKPQGSGLGLAVVYRAIEAHRGMVLVDSVPGSTRFTVLLPAASPAVETVGV